MISIRLTPNLPFISCVEIPGTVVNSGRQAVRALGGEVTLSRVLGQGVASDWWIVRSQSTTPAIQSGIHTPQQGRVFLRCSADDRFSKFLTSSTVRRSDVLLRVRRNRKTGQVVLAVPLGIVIERVTFESLADFYCCPPEISRDIKFNVDRELSENVAEPLFIPPPMFTRIVTPFNYKFEGNAFTVTGTHCVSRKLTRSKDTFDQPDIEVNVKPASFLARGRRKIRQTPQPSQEEMNPEEVSLDSVEDNIDRGHRTMEDSLTRQSGRTSTHLNNLIRRKGGDDSFNAVSRFNDVFIPIEPPAAALSVSAGEFDSIELKLTSWHACFAQPHHMLLY